MLVAVNGVFRWIELNVHMVIVDTITHDVNRFSYLQFGASVWISICWLGRTNCPGKRLATRHHMVTTAVALGWVTFFGIYRKTGWAASGHAASVLHVAAGTHSETAEIREK
ncbi:hypothetical protein ACMT1E_01430 [Sphingomonas flavalba]|uniref:hypothetical protein n=1 Tax=Sphingomonas flavalba TaxID=2559804 RepID=UPI0039E09B3D